MTGVTWKIVKWKECDGVGCCDFHGVFPSEDDNHKCRFWVERPGQSDNCRLMKDPKLLDSLTPTEAHAFDFFCVQSPVPLRVRSLDEEYTDREKWLMNTYFKPGCCYRWEKTL